MTEPKHDESELSKRLEFIGIDARASAELRTLKPLIAKALGPALNVFYEKVRSEPKTRNFFSNAQHMAQAKGRQEEHWEVITSGEFGPEYARRVKAIGEVHARLGLEPRWYIAGYAIVAEQLMHAMIKEM